MTLRETLERIRKMDVPTDEESTILQIIMPILGNLGWDITSNSSEVKREYRVGIGRVDRALMNEHTDLGLTVRYGLPRQLSDLLRPADLPPEFVLEVGTGYDGTIHYRRVLR